MDSDAALRELEALAEKLGVQVSYEHIAAEAGRSTGGLCKVKGQWRVILERRGSPSEKVSLLARCLSQFDLDAHFVSPQLREIIEGLRGR